MRHKAQMPIQESPQKGLQPLRDLLPYLWPKKNLNFRIRLCIALSFLILSKAFAVLVPLYFKEAVDALDTVEHSISSLYIALPVGILLAYGLSRIASSLFSEGRDIVFAKVEQGAVRSVALKVFEHLHALSLRYHLDRKTGGLNRAIERGIEGIEMALRFLTFLIIPTFLEVLFVCGFLLYLYPPIFALLIFITIGLYAFFTIWITQWRTQYVRAMNIANEEGNTKAIDSLLNYETVKYFCNEEHEKKRFDIALAVYEKAAVRMKTSLGVLNLVQTVIISLSSVGVMFLAARGIIQHSMTLGDFVLLNTYLLQLYIPLSNLGFSYRETKRALVNMESMFSLLEIPAEITDKPNAHSLRPKGGDILFEKVSFFYNSNRPILKDISFHVSPGKSVAIVGPSGSGKSTIARLLFRFYDVIEGRIFVDHQNIQDITQQSLRQDIAVIPQDTVLFNDTLFYNIQYGDPKATEEEIKKAATLAHLMPFISSLPEGFNTIVGERGLKLSGGEKQRVAIARALLKNPQIFIFDEATSSLDSHTEKEIQENIQKISKSHSTLIIAHRLSTIVNVDEILVLVQGEIVEHGTHKMLLKKKGVYAALWEKQQHEHKKEEV